MRKPPRHTAVSLDSDGRTGFVHRVGGEKSLSEGVILNEDEIEVAFADRDGSIEGLVVTELTEVSIEGC